MSEVVVFVGPTLTAADVRALLPTADVRAPVAQGDVLEVALGGVTRVIVIIDGYYESVPAVWHKEILWAMTHGIHVFGGASMGALRAAELHAFGMEGVGGIFEAYRDGDLEADDEVAVLHASAEDGYRKASEALVNVRATVGAALVGGVVTEEFRDQVVAAAQGLFYPDRSYPILLQRVRERGASPEETAAFEHFVASSAIDQKRDDALELLEVVRARLAAGLERKVVTFALQHTGFLELLREEVLARSSSIRQRTEAAAPDGILDEVRIDPVLRGPVQDLALRLVVAEEEARARHLRFDDERALVGAAEAFRRDSGLVEGAAFASFLARETIDDGELPRLLAAYGATRWLGDAWRERTLARYHDALRLLGLRARVAARAAEKTTLLDARGIDTPSLHDASLTEDELLGWYFRERAPQARPLDLEAYAQRIGFASGDLLVKAVLAEYLFATKR